MGSIIKTINYFLPKNTISNTDLEKQFSDWDSSKIENKVGIQQRHVVGENETALDMAYEACDELLKDFNKEDIDFLLLCTQSPDYFLPTSACILQHKLGLKTNIGAFDFNLGCSGFIYGLAVAKSLICSGISKNVLLVTSETYSKHIHQGDKANISIFGDAAAATLISVSDTDKIFKFVLGTDGRGKDNLIVCNGGMRNKTEQKPIEWTDEAGNLRSNNYLFMNGPEIFNFTIENIPPVFDQILEKNHVLFDEIDYVIFHQANKYMLDYLRKKMNIPKEKFYNDILLTGNTVSSTIPIALKNCIDNRIVKEGDKLLLLGFGVGYSWGGTIIEI
ncbi:MAG TPA: ketoacyl-ACP synthase III [Bacteroidales bacterium]|nr:ketoacyl-ACP synthase III [Bacteroidales bacterium]